MQINAVSQASLDASSSFKPNPHQAAPSARLRLYSHPIATPLRAGLIQASGRRHICDASW